ncbi:hypothetical protein [Kutzneria sp. 744]|uniref:hypothetical protein n=1 Tax=Kutzneria sp. (strain 744) TaxID=345341 RepID=UPI0005B7F94A|nr:hypothetical protein [Kutzneria sp. 744]
MAGSCNAPTISSGGAPCTWSCWAIPAQSGPYGGRPGSSDRKSGVIFAPALSTSVPAWALV